MRNSIEIVTKIVTWWWRKCVKKCSSWNSLHCVINVLQFSFWILLLQDSVACHSWYNRSGGLHFLRPWRQFLQNRLGFPFLFVVWQNYFELEIVQFLLLLEIFSSFVFKRRNLPKGKHLSPETKISAWDVNTKRHFIGISWESKTVTWNTCWGKYWIKKSPRRLFYPFAVWIHATGRRFTVARRISTESFRLFQWNLKLWAWNMRTCNRKKSEYGM